MPQNVRLTSLAHGGGCGCKLAPAVLRDILKGMLDSMDFVVEAVLIPVPSPVPASSDEITQIPHC